MTTLRTTPLGLKLLEAFEADKLVGYRCPAGVSTIGRGITGPALKEAGLRINYRTGKASSAVVVGGKITQAESDRLFAALVDYFEDKVERIIGDADLETHQFDALVSLAWNIGLDAFARSSVARFVKAGRFADVPRAFMMWTKAGGKELKGLVRRRRAEAALWRGDLEEADRKSVV